MRGAEELLGPLRARDHLAFEALVERRYEALRRYLARLVGDGEIAADLTQETFLRAYQALPRLGDDSNVGSWLYRIATNLARQHHRHRRLVCWSRLEAHQNALPGRSLEEEVATRDRVRRALEGLPLDQRVCLLLYAGTGYTCAEIGGILGRSAPAVRMLLLRARRRFRAAYGEPDGEPYGESGGAPPLDAGADGFRLPPARPPGAPGAGAVGAAGLRGRRSCRRGRRRRKRGRGGRDGARAGGGGRRGAGGGGPGLPDHRGGAALLPAGGPGAGRLLRRYPAPGAVPELPAGAARGAGVLPPAAATPLHRQHRGTGGGAGGADGPPAGPRRAPSTCPRRRRRRRQSSCRSRSSGARGQAIPAGAVWTAGLRMP